jgi:hypothetical protein
MSFSPREAVKRLLPESLKFRHERLKARLVLGALRSPPAEAAEGRGRRVTFVATGRNDDYMPQLVLRLRSVLAWNLRHAAAEAIFVEWNPPADRPLLSPDLCREFPGLRAYVVPREVHARVCANRHLQLMESHAKNAAIRRARTDFVLCSNTDIYVGPDMCRFLSREDLDERTVYLARRVDITWSAAHSPRLQMADPRRYLRVLPLDPIGPGDFILASRELWHTARGFDESMTSHRLGCDGRGVLQLRALGAAVEHVGSIFHMDHPTSSQNAVRPFHGEVASFDGVPYSNPAGWGMGDAVETPLAERVWRLD